LVVTTVATSLGACSDGDDEGARRAAPAAPSGSETTGQRAIASGDGWSLPPADASWDYQLDEAYDPADGVTVVARDWYWSTPLEDAYSICYVNAFQTQRDDDTVERPDELGSWPPDVVLTDLPDDPNWPGEYLVDLSSAATRATAAAHIHPIFEVCSEKGFDAVELDNLDSWTRLEDEDVRVPFGQREAVAYAALLADRAHGLGMAVAQKNTPQLDAEESIESVGFDFAIAEECGEYDECDVYEEVFGDLLFVVEYTEDGFEAACEAVGHRVSVVFRDKDLASPDAGDHRYEAC